MNSDIANFIYYNGEYEIAVNPDYIDVSERDMTSEIIEKNLNLSGGDWKVTTTPHSLV